MCKISEIIAILILAVTGQAANADTLPTLLSGTSPGGSTFFNASFSDVAGGVRLDLSIGSGWNSNAQLDAFYFNYANYTGGPALSTLAFTYQAGVLGTFTTGADAQDSIYAGLFDIMYQPNSAFKNSNPSATYLISTTGPGTISALAFTNEFSNSSTGHGLAARIKSGGNFGTVVASGFTATPPIPEPEVYAMMLAGLGLLGWIARRRKQSFDAVPA